MIRKNSAGDGSALDWCKSSYSSNGSEADCVEVATTLRTIHVRDSKDPDGPRLAVAPIAWASFVTYASER
ncbi:DUF397 domain-containing protein [Streptomyces sp. NPDC006307]|uniref:DUF397 domain-containing protein n=1 Tax=Streptomyces sp. NPDC006307 TaxID=3156748 RepID=UPI0033AE0CA5